jgi:hypothetical protein
MAAALSRIELLGSSVGGVVTGVTTGTSQPIDRASYPYSTLFFRSIGTTSGGVLLIEEADYDADGGEQVYSGTWSTVQTINASSFTGTAQLAVHISPVSYGFFRVRISSAITGGGTVVVTLRSVGA